MSNESAAPPCPWLSDGAKLLLAASVIGAGLVIPVRHWPAHGLLATLVFLGQTSAGIPMRYLARRMALFLPLLLLFALSLPLGQGIEKGGPIAATIVVRGVLAFLTMIWLVHVLPFPRLLSALRRGHCPALLIALLSFMHRFSFLMWHEVERMKAARRSRTFAKAGLWFRWTTNAQVIGMLLIRSLRRAEHVHSAMLARGWAGQVRTLDDAE